MVKKEVDTGETGAAVAANIRRLRGGLSYTEMSRRLQERAGWSINAVGIRRIEASERRVSVDDLFAFAIAFGVSPISLLMPDVEEGHILVTGMAVALDPRVVWSWLRAEQPLEPDQTWTEFISVAWPRWVQAQFSAEAQEQLQKSLFNFGSGGDPHGDD